MKRLMHYFRIRRRALRIRRLAEGNVLSANLTQPIRENRKELYLDDGDLGYC